MTEAATGTTTARSADGIEDAGLAAFQAQVRTETLRVADAQHWATPALNEVLAALGLDPVVELVAVDVVVELSALAGNDDSRRAFADEATARYAVESLLTHAHTYSYTCDLWQIRDVVTITRRTVTTDTNLAGVVVHQDTATSSTTTVLVAGQAAFGRIRVASRHGLTDTERDQVIDALDPLFRRIQRGHFDAPAATPTLLEITSLHLAD
jgi:hypothetical protein